MISAPKHTDTTPHVSEVWSFMEEWGPVKVVIDVCWEFGDWQFGEVLQNGGGGLIFERSVGIESCGGFAMLKCMVDDESLDWRSWLQEWGIVLVLAGMGVVALLLGVKTSWVGEDKPVVEIIAGEEVDLSNEEAEVAKPEEEWLVIDVAGAVAEPGIYRMEKGTRLGEALDKAGGFLEDADSEFVAKRINLAAKLNDGAKIYIPFKGEMNNDEEVLAGVDYEGVAGATVVNVNSASLAELDSLWGIGAARAQAIIDNRPYGSLDELKDKAGIPVNVLEQNAGKMTVD